MALMYVDASKEDKYNVDHSKIVDVQQECYHF